MRARTAACGPGNDGAEWVDGPNTETILGGAAFEAAPTACMACVHEPRVPPPRFAALLVLAASKAGQREGAEATEAAEPPLPELRPPEPAVKLLPVSGLSGAEMARGGRTLASAANAESGGE